MLLVFELSMPNVGSWNGRWTGEDRLYARTRYLGRSESAKILGKRIIKGSPFIHRWDDGWTASVSVQAVDANEARRIRRKSDGFAGYDWMIDAIVEHGEIRYPER